MLDLSSLGLSCSASTSPRRPAPAGLHRTATPPRGGGGGQREPMAEGEEEEEEDGLETLRRRRAALHARHYQEQHQQQHQQLQKGRPSSPKGVVVDPALAATVGSSGVGTNHTNHADAGVLRHPPRRWSLGGLLSSPLFAAPAPPSAQSEEGEGEGGALLGFTPREAFAFNYGTEALNIVRCLYLAAWLCTYAVPAFMGGWFPSVGWALLYVLAIPVPVRGGLSSFWGVSCTCVCGGREFKPPTPTPKQNTTTPGHHHRHGAHPPHGHALPPRRLPLRARPRGLRRRGGGACVHACVCVCMCIIDPSLPTSPHTSTNQPHPLKRQYMEEAEAALKEIAHLLRALAAEEADGSTSASSTSTSFKACGGDGVERLFAALAQHHHRITTTTSSSPNETNKTSSKATAAVAPAPVGSPPGAKSPPRPKPRPPKSISYAQLRDFLRHHGVHLPLRRFRALVRFIDTDVRGVAWRGVCVWLGVLVLGLACPWPINQPTHRPQNTNHQTTNPTQLCGHIDVEDFKALLQADHLFCAHQQHHHPATGRVARLLSQQLSRQLSRSVSLQLQQRRGSVMLLDVSGLLRHGSSVLADRRDGREGGNGAARVEGQGDGDGEV